MDLNRFSLFIAIFAICACGVKGAPSPPLLPPPIGRGEPIFSQATSTKKPIKNKYNYKREEGAEKNDDDPSDGE